MTLREQIDQVVKSKLSDREKVDELFRIDCKMYTNLGVDSTKSEIEDTKENSRIIYRAVRDIDFWLGNACLRTQDDKKKAQ